MTIDRSINITIGTVIAHVIDDEQTTITRLGVIEDNEYRFSRNPYKLGTIIVEYDNNKNWWDIIDSVYTSYYIVKLGVPVIKSYNRLSFL